MMPGFSEIKPETLEQTTMLNHHIQLIHLPNIPPFVVEHWCVMVDNGGIVSRQFDNEADARILYKIMIDPATKFMEGVDKLSKIAHRFSKSKHMFEHKLYLEMEKRFKMK